MVITNSKLIIIIIAGLSVMAISLSLAITGAI